MMAQFVNLSLNVYQAPWGTSDSTHRLRCRRVGKKFIPELSSLPQLKKYRVKITTKGKQWHELTHQYTFTLCISAESSRYEFSNAFAVIHIYIMYISWTEQIWISKYVRGLEEIARQDHFKSLDIYDWTKYRLEFSFLPATGPYKGKCFHQVNRRHARTFSSWCLYQGDNLISSGALRSIFDWLSIVRRWRCKCMYYV